MDKTLTNTELEGIIGFNIAVDLSANEVESWSSMKITEFFTGIAKVVHVATGQSGTNDDDD